MRARTRWAWRALFLLAAIGAAAPLYLVAAGRIGGEGHAAAAVEISRPPAEVFPYLVRDERVAVWLGGLLERRPLTPGPPGMGSKWIEKVGNPESPHELEVEISAYEPDRALALKIVHPELITEARYELRDRGGKTLVIYQASSWYAHPVSRLLAPVIARLDQDKLEGDLARLKLAVEGPPGAAAADAGVAPPELSDERDAGIAEESAEADADAGEAPPPPVEPAVAPDAPPEVEPAAAAVAESPPADGAEAPSEPASPGPAPQGEDAGAEPAPLGPQGTDSGDP